MQTVMTEIRDSLNKVKMDMATRGAGAVTVTGKQENSHGVDLKEE